MSDPGQRRRGGGRALARVLLAVLMVTAGVGHFVAHEAFLAQTPSWLPWRSAIVWGTGVLEIAFGIALVALPAQRRRVGWALAAFYVAVFPGNIYQAVAGNDAFGLETPAARWTRLLFQPVLVVLALWSTGAAFDARRDGQQPEAGPFAAR